MHEHAGRSLDKYLWIVYNHTTVVEKCLKLVGIVWRKVSLSGHFIKWRVHTAIVSNTFWKFRDNCWTMYAQYTETIQNIIDHRKVQSDFRQKYYAQW